MGLFWDKKQKMETIGITLGLYWDNGKEHGNYRDYYIGVSLG